MTREEAKELDKEYSRSLINFGMDLGNPLPSPIDKIYDDFEQQLANLNHNYEMQEIVIADYKKRIEELEAPKSCIECKHVGSDYGNLVCWNDKERFTPVKYHFCCKYYEPKDKQ